MKKMLLMGAVVVALCSCGTKTVDAEAEVKEGECVECTEGTCTEVATEEGVENVVTDAATKVEEVATEVEATAEKVEEAVETGKEAVDAVKAAADALKK